jgi:hypothetical protein
MRIRNFYSMAVMFMNMLTLAHHYSMKVIILLAYAVGHKDKHNHGLWHIYADIFLSHLIAEGTL